MAVASALVAIAKLQVGEASINEKVARLLAQVINGY